MKTPNYLFFDVEAGGFSGKKSSVFSISYAGRTGAVETLGARPVSGTHIGSWSASQVWKPLVSQFEKEGRTFQTEKEILSKFIRTLEGQVKGTTLAGWNIGYSTRGRGFDLPMLAERASQYGLDDKLRRALRRLEIRDLGQETAFRIARNISAAGPELVDADLRRQAVGYMKATWEAQALARDISDPVKRVAETARMIHGGPKFAGWKQGLVYEMLTGKPLLNAHMSSADVGALREIFEQTRSGMPMGPREISTWNRLALHNKLVGGVRFGRPTQEILGAAAEAETRWGYRGFKEGVRAGIGETAAAYGTTFERLAAGGKISEQFFRVTGEHVPGSRASAWARGAVEHGWSILRKHPGKAGIAVGLGAMVLLKPLSWFSGSDEEHNTITGLPHGGTAERLRRGMTDFGSGWRGIVQGAKKYTGALRKSPELRQMVFAGLGISAAAGAVSYGAIYGTYRLLRDDPNTVKGMGESGMAPRGRHSLTDFGSGFQSNAADGSFISEQVADNVITENEYRSLLRKVRAARDQKILLQLLDKESARKSFNRQLRWRDPAKAGEVTNQLTQRGALGQFGSYNFKENLLSVGGYIAPEDILAGGLGYMYQSPNDRRIGEMTYMMLNPKKAEETVLHEGLHAIWQRDIDPAHKQVFIQEAEEQLGTDSWTPWLFRKMGPDVTSLAGKHPVYRNVIFNAMRTEDPGSINWVANEMFAHRGAALNYQVSYNVSRRKDLDEVVGQYVTAQGGGKTQLRPTFAAGFDPEEVLAETFTPVDIAAAREKVASRKQPTRTEMFSRELPTSLMDQPIDPDILRFRREVLSDPDAKRSYQEELRESQREAQERLGQLLPGDLDVRGLETIEAINQRDQRLKSVKLDRFDVEVEDADTVLLKRKGLLPTIKSLFGYGDISVRLSGIDAPETSGHSGDPLEMIRMWQDQPGGGAATNILESMLEEQGDDLEVLVSTGKKTYGRYLGVLAGEEGENINMELIRAGAVSALPFGPSREDILLREQARAAEETAWTHREGMWAYSRYQAERITNQYVGRTITHNTLTRMDKMAQNLNLGAYGSFLESFGASQRELTVEEISQSRRMGLALKKTHGPPPQRNRPYNPVSGRDDDHNTIEGLGHEGIAWQIRQAMTDFGSGWIKGLVQRAKGAIGGEVKSASQTAWGSLRQELGSKAFQQGLPALRGARQELGGVAFAERVSQGTLLQTTEAGERFAIGKQLAEGGMGRVESAYQLSTGRRSIYKTLKDKAPTEGGLYTNPDALVIPGGGEWGKLFNEDPLRTQDVLLGQQNVMREVYKKGSFKSPLRYEAEMQHLAHLEQPDVVPAMLGMAKGKTEGFFQEFAGRAINRKDPQEVSKAMFFLQDQAKKMYTKGTNSRMIHFDLHIDQVMMSKEGKFKLVDWGVAGKAGPEYLEKYGDDAWTMVEETLMAERTRKAGAAEAFVKQRGAARPKLPKKGLPKGSTEPHRIGPRGTYIPKTKTQPHHPQVKTQIKTQIAAIQTQKTISRSRLQRATSKQLSQNAFSGRRSKSAYRASGRSRTVRVSPTGTELVEFAPSGTMLHQ